MTSTELVATIRRRPAVGYTGRRAVMERATVREVLMGAQDNLTNVLAVMLGVSIGSGRVAFVALACISAAVAEAVSMGGVLYTSTRAEDSLDGRLPGASGASPAGRLSPAMSGVITFAAALVAGLVPLAPFAVVPLTAAVPISMAISVAALFGLGLDDRSHRRLQLVARWAAPPPRRRGRGRGRGAGRGVPAGRLTRGPNRRLDDERDDEDHRRDDRRGQVERSPADLAIATCAARSRRPGRPWRARRGRRGGSPARGGRRAASGASRPPGPGDGAPGEAS